MHVQYIMLLLLLSENDNINRTSNISGLGSSYINFPLKPRNRQCKLCEDTGEITLKKEKMFVKMKYQFNSKNIA